VIITARSESQREGTEDWIAEYMPDSPFLYILFDRESLKADYEHSIR